MSPGLASGGMGPAVVTWEACAAWSELTGTRREPWEWDALVMLGQLRAAILAEAAAKDAKL